MKTDSENDKLIETVDAIDIARDKIQAIDGIINRWRDSMKSVDYYKQIAELYYMLKANPKHNAVAEYGRLQEKIKEVKDEITTCKNLLEHLDEWM